MIDNVENALPNGVGLWIIIPLAGDVGRVENVAQDCALAVVNPGRGDHDGGSFVHERVRHLQRDHTDLKVQLQ